MRRWEGLLLVFLLLTSSLPPVIAQETVCGDGECNGDETCGSCVIDCLPEGSVCCDDISIVGDCCIDSDCSGDDTCVSNVCTEPDPVCGDGLCNGDETCGSCVIDCLPEGSVCCDDISIVGDCCIDSDCSGDDTCVDNVCASASVIVESVCGDGSCDPGEDCSSCESDCGPCVVETSIDDYKASLSLSGSTKDAADTIISYIDDCEDEVQGVDYYDMYLVCRKAEYYIREQLSGQIGLSDSSWKSFIDYIILESVSDPSYWTDSDGVVNVNRGQQLISQKLNLWLDRYESHDGSIDASVGLNVDWRSMSLTDAQQDEVEQAEDDYWSWEEALRKDALRNRVSGDFSSGEVSLGGEMISAMQDVETKIKAHDSDYDSDSAYDLAYYLRLSEGVLRGLTSGVDIETSLNACKYASLNGPGSPHIWEDEFGEVQVHGSQIYESDSHNGLRAEFNCWEGDDEAGASLWVNWDRGSSNDFRDSIRAGRSDADDEARAMEVAGQLADYLEGFEISSDNKDIAEEVISLIDELVEDAGEVELVADSLYSFNYDTIIKSAEVQGIAQSLSCDDIEEVGPYVIVYSEGTPNLWEDEFGDLTLSTYKQLFENDFLRLNFNYNCDDFSGDSWMSIHSDWGADVTRDSELASSLRESRDNAQQEADRMRRKAMVFRARKNYNFTLDQEEVGDSIIDKLKSFKEQIIAFESSPSSTGAYDLMYNSILLSAEVEGIAQAYSDDNEYIGYYVLLYGPGIANVWENEFDELEVGHNLNVYRGDDLEFNFNRWVDERSGRGGFNSWLNFGRLRRDYDEEIKRAEREAWVEADILRRKGLAMKARDELEAEGFDANSHVAELKDYITLFNRYLNGNSSAFDLELKRLQVSDELSDLDPPVKDLIMVSDLGEDVPPPDVWLDWDTDEIMVGDWRELVLFNRSLEQPFTGLSGWCEWETDVCNLDIHIDWVNWSLVRRDIDRANELFWRQKREAELTDELARIVGTLNNYSIKDQGIESELVDLLGDLGVLGESYSDPEAFQYDVLVKQDSINDKLDEADDQGVIRVAVADADGFHEFDDWLGEVRGVVLFSSEDIEIIARFNEVFTPFFLEGDEGGAFEFDVMIDVVWKNWTSTLGDAIERAYERYQSEQAINRFNKLVERRDEVIPSNLEELIRAKVDSYENGEINMSDLKRYVNNYYYRIMGYDNEVAYFAALSNNSFPEFDLVNIVVNTAHVTLQLYERDFTYRFGGAARIDTDFLAPSDEFVRREFEIRDPELVSRSSGVSDGALEGLTGRAVTTNTGVVEPEVTVTSTDESWVASGPEAWDEATVEDFERERQELTDSKHEMIDRVQEERLGMFDNRKLFRPKGFQDRVTLPGIKPRLKFSVDMTPEEVKRLAQEIKAKWAELNESGIIYDIIYNINNDADEFPALQDAIREWGDVTTSIRLRYQNESVLELSFTTEDGYVTWVDYGVIENAGVDPNTVFIELDFESLMRLKNNWEQGMKNAEGFFDVIASIPGLIAQVTGMLMGGEIRIVPFGTVFRIPNMLKVMFEAMMEGSGISI